ncbi:hypothetical protein [Aggregatibacter actinomycetemcomitans]|uniref:hypothetical protein n=1 Tax=Aggregatibacter actinomycetemcomitans TaxID=714 RepID=UPI0011D71F12|nr:hypothetical protein [Aggregatibacter actinomycetemcomitans]TYA29176.1 hypothetical protein FXB96_04990 [Aggregatibacter actinomycetemcomitans]TYB11881.1 hypothetical protein FXB84_04520 [Aggregatibacter actinomycetemcomitans]
MQDRVRFEMANIKQMRLKMSKVLYRYKEYDEPKNPDDGEPWVSEEYKDLKCIISDIAQENHIAWELYNKSDGIDIYIWLDGDFDNRKKFAVSPYYRLLFSVTELE